MQLTSHSYQINKMSLVSVTMLLCCRQVRTSKIYLSREISHCFCTQGPMEFFIGFDHCIFIMIFKQITHRRYFFFFLQMEEGSNEKLIKQSTSQTALKYVYLLRSYMLYELERTLCTKPRRHGRSCKILSHTALRNISTCYLQHQIDDK